MVDSRLLDTPNNFIGCTLVKSLQQKNILVVLISKMMYYDHIHLIKTCIKERDIRLENKVYCYFGMYVLSFAHWLYFSFQPASYADPHPGPT